ncbi:MAG: hypothetical protein WCS34_00040 [Bacteroidales bacterium]
MKNNDFNILNKIHTGILLLNSRGEIIFKNTYTDKYKLSKLEKENFSFFNETLLSSEQKENLKKKKMLESNLS